MKYAATPSPLSGSARGFLLAGLLCVFFLGACAQSDGYDLFAENDLDELVEAPYLPQDDGIPLSFSERIAFRSTGLLDASLSAEELKIVERHFKYYLHNHRPTIELYLTRAGAYLAYLRKVFMDNGLPEEIIHLAAVESGFNPRAVSRAGAMGMWQFMPATGRQYGLTQNHWIDERRDTFKATLAAVSYLKMLKSRFGDWFLAIAAYNAGENKIEQAMRGTGAEDFFQLCRLNARLSPKQRLKAETQQYVPRLLAMIKIMRNLEILGFTPPPERQPEAVATIKVAPGTDLNALASGIGLRLEDFRNLNPAYRSHISPPHESSAAYVPDTHRQTAVAWLAKTDSSKFAGWRRYQVRRGDSLYALSRRHGISASLLMQANKMPNANLREGAVIIVPGGSGNSSLAAAESKPPAGSSPAGNNSKPRAVAAGSTIHTVRRGESLYSIARSYGVSVDSLRKTNNMRADENFLSAGQKLGIPSKSAPAQRDAGEARLVVRKGDTLYGIAMQNKTSVEELVRLNGLTPGKPILPGQEIRLP
ncbi:MAG: LysM peptidoglycan-binding domain-containing protein [Desulfovibrionaceae bacterium]|nr:LysM peptidoglycan-binding domain-containing protein [Desulfovibrionaceae bacterium]